MDHNEEEVLNNWLEESLPVEFSKSKQPPAETKDANGLMTEITKSFGREQWAADKGCRQFSCAFVKKEIGRD